MKTAVIYARFSSDKQPEASIDGQLRVCTEYAQRNDIVIVGTYIDRAMTGTNDNRDEFQQMLKDSDRKEWDYCLVYKLDRFSRNKYEMAIHRKRLKDNGVKILSAMENIPDSPEGVLLKSLLEGMNQYFSEELSQKVKRGLRESHIKGNAICNRVPYGWDKVNKKYVINEQEAEIVREVFNTYLSGKTTRQIADMLVERGIKNKELTFKENQIYTMLHNEKYTGIYRIHDQVYDNIFPAIITTDLFERTQKHLAMFATGKHVPDVSYLLRGKIKCGHCGKNYVAWTGKDRYGNTRRYYRCNGNTHPCKSIKKDTLESIVSDVIAETFGNDKNLETATAFILKRQDEKNKLNTGLALLEKEYDGVIKSIKGIMKAIEMGVVTETTRERLEELETQKRELTERIAVEKTKQPLMLTKDAIKEFVKAALKQPTQVLLDCLVQGIIIYDDKIEITFTTAFGTPPNGNRPTKTINKDYKDSDQPDRGSFYMIMICRKPHEHAYRPTVREYTVNIFIYI